MNHLPIGEPDSGCHAVRNSEPLTPPDSLRESESLFSACSLEQTLVDQPYRFDFFQAVRLLESRLPPGCVPVGGKGPPAREAVRFLARLGLAFPASAVHHLERADRPDRPSAMTVNFLGLTGPSGVLPRVYTELLRSRARAGEPAPAAFLDLINHRLVSLFYRAWEKHRVALNAHRAESDRFSEHVFALMGLGLHSHRERQSFQDRVLLKYARFFADERRPAVVLEAMLRDHTGLPVEVIPFSGRRLTLDPADRSALTSRAGLNKMGAGLMLGTRIWNAAGQVRIRLGPLSYAEFRDYLPDGKGFGPLLELTRLFVGAGFNLDVQLVLKAEATPRCRLSSGKGQGAQLGRSGWLLGRPPAREADDAVFRAGA